MTRFHWMGRGAGALALMLPLAACETPPLSANVVNASEAQVAQRATFGTVVGFRQVLVQGGNQGAELAGTAGGAAIGIAAGNQIGDGRGRDAAQAIGGIIGAVAGNRAARGATSQQSFEWTVQLDTGATISVIQSQPTFGRGQRVQVIQGAGGLTRLVAA